MSAALGRVAALAGVALVAVGVSQPAFFSSSYWSTDGTLAWFGLVLALTAVPLALAGFVRARTADGWLFAVGAVLVGYFGWLPAAIATHHWVGAGSGMWLTLAGAFLIAAGGAFAVIRSGNLRSTPAGLSSAALVAGIGIALYFPGIFLNADSGDSYWTGPFGHSLGVIMLTLAILTAIVWAATVFVGGTRGADVALTLVVLGLVGYEPVSRALYSFDSLASGAWIAFAGGVLAAVGTWSARG